MAWRETGRECPACNGTGALNGEVDYDGDSQGFHPCHADCPECDGMRMELVEVTNGN
jgi:hypothetical protein